MVTGRVPVPPIDLRSWSTSEEQVVLDGAQLGILQLHPLHLGPLSHKNLLGRLTGPEQVICSIIYFVMHFLACHLSGLPHCFTLFL